MTDGPAELEVSDRRPPIWARVSVVWFIPLFALVISLFVAWQNYTNRGVLVSISFEDAAGIDAGKTVVKFRDVDIGLVESVGFSADLNSVTVKARVDQNVAPYLDADAIFWVARPRVTTRGISEIDTLVSGVYIEGSWDNRAGEARTEFAGMETPPLVRVGADGTFIQLRAPDAGSLAAGAPILYKGIEVGQIEDLQLADGGDHVIVDAFVEAPHNTRLTNATRFWNLSGFSLSFGAGGVELDVDSLASLVEGGIGFATVYSGGTPIRDGHVFELFEGEAEARESIFNRRIASELRLSIAFDGSVKGLVAGAPVTYRGVAVGEVENLTATVVEDADGQLSDVQLLTNIIISPGKLGLPDTATRSDTLDFLEASVAGGLRARIASANILTGSLLVELVERPDETLATFDRDAEPFPLLPTSASAVEDFAATAEGLFERVNALPVEELMTSTVSLMNSLDRLASDEAAQGTPEAIVSLLDDTRALINSENVQAVPADLRATIASINTMLDEINTGGAVANLLAALEETRAVAEDINKATDTLPELVTKLDSLAQKAIDLPLEGFIADTRGLVTSADELIGSDAVKAVPETVAALMTDTRALINSEALRAAPGELQAALARINTILAEFERSGSVAGLASAIGDAQKAAANVSTASEALPKLVSDVEELAAKAADLPLDELVTSTRGLIETANGLLASEDVRALPGSLGAALDEIQNILAALEEGGAVTNLNSALSSAATASDAVATAVKDLPALAERLNRLAAQAGATLSAYNADSDFNYQTRAALREIAEAAEAVSSLSRAIERRPNSLLIGR